MAERQGFEPWDQFPGQVISSHLQSATLPPLRTKVLLSNTKFTIQIYLENGEVLCMFPQFNIPEKHAHLSSIPSTHLHYAHLSKICKYLLLMDLNQRNLSSKFLWPHMCYICAILKNLIIRINIQK